MATRRTRRVVVLTPGLVGTDGISEVSRQYVSLLAAAMASAGGHLEVWSLADTGRPPSVPAAARFRGAGGSRLRFASWAVTNVTADRDTVVVGLHVHLLAVALPLVWRGARLAVVMYGIEVWKPLRRLERHALRQAWRRLAISRHTRDRFRQAHPALQALPVEVCAPAVPVAVAPIRDTTPGPFAVIVGRMVAAERYKGHDGLLDLWPRIQAAVPQARLIVVGDGDDRPRLEARVQAEGLTGGVVFTGRVDDATLAALYRDATCLVMPSAGEGFGLVYLEAMRAGTPCVAREGAAEEIITDGVDGVIVRGGDADVLVQALVRLFTEAPWRARLGAHGAETVRERFMTEQTAACVRRALDLEDMGTPC